MAVRLNVIMVHAPAGTNAAQRLTEAVVGELIGLSGIDLTLIDQIAQIDPTSTDYLTLDSLSGDVAVLAWRPVAESIRSLSELGFRGSRARHAHDRAGPDAGRSRSIYGYDLSEFDSPQQVCAALSDLLDARQVRTYSLEGLISDRPPLAAKKNAADASQGAPKTSESSAPQHLGDASPGPTSTGRSPGKPRLDLDDLVDQLDCFDP